MKRKFFLAAGALLLASLGVFVGRASSKFGPATALYVSDGASNCITLNSSYSQGHFTTNSVGSGTKATITTASGTLRNIFATSNCNSAFVYFQ